MLPPSKAHPGFGDPPWWCGRVLAGSSQPLNAPPDPDPCREPPSCPAPFALGGTSSTPAQQLLALQGEDGMGQSLCCSSPRGSPCTPRAAPLGIQLNSPSLWVPVWVWVPQLQDKGGTGGGEVHPGCPNPQHWLCGLRRAVLSRNTLRLPLLNLFFFFFSYKTLFTARASPAPRTKPLLPQGWL